MAIAAAALSVAACNKAEYKTANYVCFDSNRANIQEACGIYVIPVTLHNASDCIATYKITDGTAKAGVDYEIIDELGKPDKSGIVKVEGGRGFIYVKVKDQTGILTKNLTFTVEILASATDGVVVGATKTIACTIIDSDAGINMLIGDWYGTSEETISWSIKVIDETTEEGQEILAAFPEANLIISDILLNGGDMDSAVDIYARYDENTNKVIIYKGQPFNAYNFGSIGVNFVGFGLKKDAGDCSFTVGDNQLVADDALYINLYTYDENWEPGVETAYSGYYYVYVSSGFTMKKSE